MKLAEMTKTTILQVLRNTFFVADEYFIDPQPITDKEFYLEIGLVCLAIVAFGAIVR